MKAKMTENSYEETTMREYKRRRNEEEAPRLRKDLIFWEKRARAWDRSAAFHALIGVCSFCLMSATVLSMFATDPLFAQSPNPMDLTALGIGVCVIIHSAWMVFVQIPIYKNLPVKAYYKTLHVLREFEKGDYWATAAVEFDRKHSEAEFLGKRID